ncbi:MAG: hypothetical protein L6Q54_06820 [Leptospiraceae bacterium]|nr:hypothetical protein [Leptospiraceae bacterium]
MVKIGEKFFYGNFGFIGCSTPNTKSTDIWGTRSANLGTVTPNYKLLGKVQGTGCTIDGTPEKYTFYAGYLGKKSTAFDFAQSIAMYNAMSQQEDADLVIHSTTKYEVTNSGDKICANVRGLAVKITDINGAKTDNIEKAEETNKKRK